MSRLIFLIVVLTSGWSFAAEPPTKKSCLQILSFAPAFTETRKTAFRDVKQFQDHRVRRINFNEVDQLLAEFESDSAYYANWLHDFQIRAAQGNYTPAELVAASVEAGGRGPRLYEAVKEKNNLGGRIRWTPDLFMSDKQSSRTAVRKHQGMIATMIQFISPIPLPLPNFSSMKYDLILPHEITDLDHAIVSTHDALEQPAGLTRKNIIFLAANALIWRPTEERLLGWIRGRYKPGTPLNLWRTFLAEIYERDSGRRELLLDYLKDPYSLDVLTQLENELSPYEKSIAAKYGPDGLYAELISAHGKQYATQIFRKTLKATLILGVLGYKFLNDAAGEGIIINGKFQNPSGSAKNILDADPAGDECTDEERTDIISTITTERGWSPFKLGFINVVPDYFLPSRADKTACDPQGVIGQAYVTGRLLHPKTEPDDKNFTTWTKTESENIVKYQDIIREQFKDLKSGCSERYFKIQCHLYNLMAKQAAQ